MSIPVSRVSMTICSPFLYCVVFPFSIFKIYTPSTIYCNPIIQSLFSKSLTFILFSHPLTDSFIPTNTSISIRHIRIGNGSGPTRIRESIHILSAGHIGHLHHSSIVPPSIHIVRRILAAIHIIEHQIDIAARVLIHKTVQNRPIFLALRPHILLLIISSSSRPPECRYPSAGPARSPS